MSGSVSKLELCPDWPPRNALLNLLPRADLNRLRPLLEPMEMKPRRILFYPQSPPDHVYFVEEGLVSVLARVDERRAVEVWLTGKEGMLGIPAILGSTVSAYRRVSQLGGFALRMRADDLRSAMREIPNFNRLLLRYVHAVLVQTAQIGACNSAHRLQQRLARWLLSAQVRSARRVLPLTHDMLSRMLGVRRAGVSEAIGALEKAGILRATRGHVQVCDSAALEARACPCYGIMNSEYERMRRDLQAAFQQDPVVRELEGGTRRTGLFGARGGSLKTVR